MNLGQSCDGCNLEYAFDTGNAVIYWFENAPWFSYVQTICPQCRQMARSFIRDTYEQCMEFFIKEDFGFITEAEPPAELVAHFEAIYGVHEAEPVAITKRHELEIQNLHVVLENIPDDLLMSMFTDTAPPKERPESWI